MAAFKEVMFMLRGGLNTAIDPSIIGDDQMVEASGMEYRPPRLGLFGVGGRTRGDSGTILGNKVFGLAWCGYDDAPADGYLIALASPSSTAFGYIASAQSDGTLVFAAIGTEHIPTGTHLWSASATAFADAVHLLGNWIFYNGADKNLIVAEDDVQAFGSVGGAGGLHWSQHGLMSVSASGSVTPTATGAGGAGTLAPGDYEVWWSEVSLYAEDRDGAIISAYDGTVTTFTISASGIGAIFTFPNSTYVNESSIKVLWLTRPSQKYPFGFRAGGVLGTSTTTYITTADITQPYEIVAPYGGVPVSAASEPPRAFCMDVFNGSLCCIDVENRQFVRFSLPDNPHKFPEINYVPIETPYQDKGMAMKTINDVMMVFGTRHTLRFNYLPRHTDSEDITAGRGKCYDVISDAHGCVSPRGVAAFSVVEGESLCLFVCRDGIHITDGTRIGYATEDLDWNATVSKANLSRCVLKNNPKRHRVEFYYVDATDTTQFKRLDFYYHPTLIRQGEYGFPKLPILGPVRVPGLAPAVGIFSSDHQVWSGDENNPRVWIEATGTEDGSDQENADGRITKAWKTKSFYFAGMNGEFDLFKVYTHQSQTTASGTYTVTGEWLTDDIGTPFTATGTVDQSLKGGQPHPEIYGRAQRFALRGEKTDGGAWQELNYLVFVIKSGTELMSAKSSS